MDLRTAKKGEAYGRWNVVRGAAKDNHGRTRVVVSCVCGAEAIVLESALVNGHTTGCKKVACRNAHKPSDAPSEG